MTEAGRRRVLVVDDEPDIRFMLCTVLETYGAEVVGEARNGIEAVALSAQLQPEVVVLDLMMPELDGFGALPEIVKGAPAAKVVVCTARVLDERDEQTLMSEGAAQIVLKGTSLTKSLVAAIA